MSFERYLQRVRVCRTLDVAAFVPWAVGGEVVGRIHRERIDALLAPPTPFRRAGDRIVLDGLDAEVRSAALAQVAARFAAAGLARPPLGELYPVAARPDGPTLLRIDRSVVTWFGVPARGVHLNGYRRTAAGPEMWVARRARGKRTYPGHLDNLVAGGQSIDLDAMTTLHKECQEEAGIGAALAARAVAVGSIRYAFQEGRDCKADTLACFDLELPADFAPVPVDGEVESFAAWSWHQVATSLAGDDVWKPNCALVALHFLLRHGALDHQLSLAQRTALWRELLGEASA